MDNAVAISAGHNEAKLQGLLSCVMWLPLSWPPATVTPVCVSGSQFCTLWFPVFYIYTMPCGATCMLSRMRIHVMIAYITQLRTRNIYLVAQFLFCKCVCHGVLTLRLEFLAQSKSPLAYPKGAQRLLAVRFDVVHKATVGL